MQRITISLDDETAQALDVYVEQLAYEHRSEAVRDLVREAVNRRAATAGGQTCIGILSYVFDHERRDLAQRLTHTHHGQPALSLSTLHLHLDATACLEVAVLRGRAADLRTIGDRVSSERGVRFGDLRLIAEADEEGPASSA